MRLKYEIQEVCRITDTLKVEMFNLMERHYANMVWDDFIADLSEKHWVILLYTQVSELVGFSTQRLIIPNDNQALDNCVVLFSGDTIISHEHWGSIVLPVAFLKLCNSIVQNHPDKTLYWMLITKGLRTYKYLSVFFMDYFPCYFAPTPPFMAELMAYLGKWKFGAAYSPENGIIKACTGSQFLREDFQPNTKNNPVADFFFRSNPGFFKGDELLCMAEISDSNLHPFIQRAVKNYV